MFNRRLALLGAGGVVVFAGLAVQLCRLTVVQGSQWRQRAEATLVRSRLIATA